MRGGSFFEDVPQIEVALGGERVRLPIFYYDGTAQTAVFAARYGALRRLMPDSRLVPARLAPGLGVVSITCFEYRDTDIGPYNELAISVPLNDPWFLANLPGRALIHAVRRRQFHAWVHHLPVTTEIARVAGVELYNYPKFVGGIDFLDDGNTRSCRLSAAGEHILTLTGRRIPAERSGQTQLFSHLWHDRQPQSSEFKLNASAVGVTSWPRAASLELGDRHPIARELAGLLVSRRPIQYQLLARFEGILYGPEHLTVPLLERTLAGRRERESATA